MKLTPEQVQRLKTECHQLLFSCIIQSQKYIQNNLKNVATFSDVPWNAETESTIFEFIDTALKTINKALNLTGPEPEVREKRDTIPPDPQVQEK